MSQVEVLKKLKVVFCSFLLIVHTSVLGVKYFPCNCGSFKACNPAPSHYHGNLDWKLDVKKKKFGGLAETTLLLPASIYAFILLLWEVFGWDFASNLGVFLTVFPAEISPTYFFPLQEYRERGETVWLLKGMWEACCPPLRLSLLWDPCFKMRSFDFFTEWLAICSHLIYFRDIRDWKRATTTQKFKWGGVGGDWGGGVWWAKSVNKSDHNSSTLTDLVSAGPVGGFLSLFVYVISLFRQICFDSKLLATWTRTVARLRPGSRSCTSAGTRRRSWRPSSRRWWTPTRPNSLHLSPWGWESCRTPSSDSRIPGATPDKY